jgi:hypothetical protein
MPTPSAGSISPGAPDGADAEPQCSRGPSEIGQDRCRRSASSVRWRSLRPPKLLLGETSQLCRILVAFTRPYFGRASSMPKTFAVSRYGGGASSSGPIDTLPSLEVPFELGAKRTNLVGRSKRVHALIQVALGCHPVLERVLVGDDIGAETARAPSAPRAETPAPKARCSSGTSPRSSRLQDNPVRSRPSPPPLRPRFAYQVCIPHRPRAKATKT